MDRFHNLRKGGAIGVFGDVANMGTGEHIGQEPVRMVRRKRFFIEHVECRAGNAPCLQCFN